MLRVSSACTSQTLVVELSRLPCGESSLEALEYEIQPGVPLVVELDEAVFQSLARSTLP